MADPTEVHRLRRVMERAEEVKETSTLARDLQWILHAYDIMIDALVEIQECSTTRQTAQLATDCLNRIDYIGPTY